MSVLEPILESDFVRAVPASLRTRLESLARPCSVPTGAVLFAEGASHPDFHVVASGHVRLDMLVPRRGRVPILTAGPGDVLAWSALVGNSIMTSSAVALDAVTTVAFPGDQLLQLCEAEHELGYHVMKQLATALSRRLVATRLQLLDLFGDHVPVLENASILDLTPAAGRPGDPEC